jgi:hypothetical protein
MSEPFSKGTIVEKTNSAEGKDTHKDGARAVVVRALGPVEDQYGYFVRWDDLPGIDVFVAGSRIRAVSAEAATA